MSSKLEHLIAELCPDGVEYKKLGEVLTIKNGKDYKGFAEGEIPVYGTGGIMTYIDTFVCDRPSVLIPRKGSLDKLYYVNVPFWTVDTIFWTDINPTIIIPKFVYYYLQMQHLEDLNAAGGVPSLTQTLLNNVKIPLPPLPVQQEIVRILDNFTELTAELTAELIARKKQYEYYRDLLLTFGDANNTILTNRQTDRQTDRQVRWLTLGEICELSAGGDVPKERCSKVKNELYSVPIYSNGIGDNALYGWTDEARIKKPCVTIAARGTIGHVILHELPFVPIIRLICAVPKDFVNVRYLKYAADTLTFKVPTSGIPQLTVPMVSKYKIPVPSLDEQERIVKILDKFDALTTDITTGLPAEIAARQKQYEHYRDKLLTFKEKIA